MNRLMKADLKRIIAKPSMYVIVLILVLFILFKDAASTAAGQMELYKSMFGNIGLIFLSIPIFLSVYSDEIKSGIMISMIGMGMERKNIVFSKLKEGQVSKPVAYGNDYYIFKLEKIFHPDTDKNAALSRDGVRQFLQNKKLEDYSIKAIKDLRNRALIEKKL